MKPKIFSTTKAPNVAASTGPETSWTNPNNIKLDDATSASVGFSTGGEMADPLTFSDFGFTIPANAVIDGVVMTIDGANFSITGTVKITSDLGNSPNVDVTSLNTSYGGSEDLWSLALTPTVVNDANFGGSIDIFDTSGGDGTASVDYVTLTVYWHYDVSVDPADVPIRQIYKVYSNDGSYLGLLPKVTSEFGFAQDINSAGSSINIECAVSIDTSRLETDYLLTEDGDYLTDEDGNRLVTEGQVPIVSEGSDDETSLIKNGNRVAVWESSYWYPNGKLMFTGQINRISAGIGSSSNKIKILVRSDGYDFDNYIARGTPFAYTTDVSQTVQNTFAAVTQESKGAGWLRYGQSWIAGAGVTNIGAINLLLFGNADVTVTVFNAINGVALGSVTQSVNTAGVAAVVQFGFPSLIPVGAGSTYFFAVSVGAGQLIYVYCTDGNVYANGAMHVSNYAGAGGGSYIVYSNGAYDLYFVVLSGTVTTTATYNSKDPVTEMFVPIIDDYNLRGGRITVRDVEATGLSLSYTFNTNTVLDAIKSCREMAPNGFYTNVDLGTSEIDFLRVSALPDFIMIKGRHLNSFELVMSIENLKNQLLFSGAETAGTNLYTVYEDSDSISRYGLRLERKADNRVSVQTTADAVGESFIAEKKDETDETVIRVMYKTMDITLLTTGKLLGFAGFGNFGDRKTMQIVRREYKSTYVDLTLGVLPKRLSPQIEQLTRSLLAQETVANPSAPS